MKQTQTAPDVGNKAGFCPTCGEELELHAIKPQGSPATFWSTCKWCGFRRDGETVAIFTRDALPLDNEVRFILGRPSFVLAPVAHRLRELGHDIAHKCEDEQAAVIHWLLTLYFKHGREWRNKVKAGLGPAIKPEAIEQNTELSHG